MVAEAALSRIGLAVALSLGLTASASSAETVMLRCGHLIDDLQNGFTTLRDPGDEDLYSSTIEIRDAIARGDFEGPRLFVAPHMISPTGGHGDFNDLAADLAIQVPNVVVDGPDAMRKAVREEITLDQARRHRGGDVLDYIIEQGEQTGIPADRIAKAKAARLGLSPMAAIKSATANAARVLGIEKDAGTLEVGKRADLVAVPRDPLADVTALESVTFVMKDGRVVKAAGAATTGDMPAASKAVADAGTAYLDFLERDSLYLRMKFGLPIDRLPDLSLAKEEADARFARELLARLEAIRPADLSEDETLSLDILRRQLRATADAPRFHWLNFPVTPYASPFGIVNRAFATFAIPDEGASARYLALLRQMPAFIGAVRAQLEGQAARGIRIARPELDLAGPFVSSLAGDGPASPYAVGPERLAALPAASAQAFRDEVVALITRDVNPPLRALADWLGGEYRAQAPESVGLGQYPGGPEYYAWLVRLHTTMDVTPEQVHRIGLERVAAIDAEMKKVRDGLGFPGSKAEFRAKLKADPRFFPRTPEEIGQRLMTHVGRIEPKVDAFFPRRPRAPYGVKRLEPQLEPGQTFGYYNPPTASDPTGYYYFNGSSLADRSLLNAGALTYHELVPGHHFQINLAYENEAIPAFRRETMDTAYTEGWGEYASGLAGEMGMYEDPYDRYGRLAMEMFITVRLVVDTGMNALGWPRAKAVAFMRDNLMETDTQIASESLRYSCDIPGQALAYKMGALQIQRLRDKAQAALGPRFDVRRFHEAVLGSGSLPMTTLERHVDWFIAQEKKR